ncbi:MAG: hypothetical protein JO051_03765 [Acidobacteriaceae bacterium]|nr:hypothetical protein [Acidobacteriaceae bacterium]
MKRILLLALLFAACTLGQMQPREKWLASWITHPTAPLREPIVLHFRRDFQLDQAPAHFVVHVSADNRFVLYVNRTRVGEGPARGDLAHWRYETFDLAPVLKAGANTIAATVWNFGVDAPIAQVSDRTAFLLESNTDAEKIVNTGPDWMVEVEAGHTIIPPKLTEFQVYMAAGPGEQIDAARYDWDWQTSPTTTPGWTHAASPIRENVLPGAARAHSAGTEEGSDWSLQPDQLPTMEYRTAEAGSVVRADSGELNPFPAQPVKIPANAHVHLLLDRKTLITAYPELTVSGGRGSQVRLTYAEALYDKKLHKGDRDEVGTREALGIQDLFLPDGSSHRSFQPLWWRTWRYLDMEVQTASEPVTLESLRAHFTAFPFEERASFHSNDADLDRIWDISWRTARMDAHETYMDTPYYEQLQYIGDTRIQALISYAVAGDDRLAKQALAAFDESRIPDGITMSRAPSSRRQIIPPFSLIFVNMLHDYWMYRPDIEPAKSALPGTRTVLAWFARYEQPDGLLRRLPWWSFIDWVPHNGLPNYDAAGESCTTTLQYLGALNDAAELEAALGDKMLVERYHARAAHVRQGLHDRCWDEQRGLLADNPSHNIFSQQTNSLAVLFDVIPAAQQKDVLAKIASIQPGGSTQEMLSATYYFRFYLARALVHAGEGDLYLSSLQPWRDLLPLHFSTWPEEAGDSRSDSHAWSAHPIYDLLTIVAGIEPASPGFQTVRIAPHPGSLPHIEATYPHPAGNISISFDQRGTVLHGVVTLPAGLTGTFQWGEKVLPLHAGKNILYSQ